MNETPSLLIRFDPKNWGVKGIYPNGSTDEQTAKLLEIAEKAFGKKG